MGMSNREIWLDRAKEMLKWDECTPSQQRFISGVLGQARINPYIPTDDQTRLLRLFYNSLKKKRANAVIQQATAFDLL